MTERFAFLHGSQPIVCMTEKTTECLHLLGEVHRIVGISSYTVRPREPRNGKPAADECLHQRQDRQSSGVAARLGLWLFRYAGRYCCRADPLGRAVHGVKPTQCGIFFSMLYQAAAIVSKGVCRRVQMDSMGVSGAGLHAKTMCLAGGPPGAGGCV